MPNTYKIITAALNLATGAAALLALVAFVCFVSVNPGPALFFAAVGAVYLYADRRRNTHK